MKHFLKFANFALGNVCPLCKITTVHLMFHFSFQVRGMCTATAMVRPPIHVFGTDGKYATALYSAAAKSKKLDDVEKELVKFQGLLTSDKKAREYLLDPTIKRAIKQNALLEIAKSQNYNQITANFLGLVAGNGRLNMINQIVNVYKTLMAAQRGEVICEVVTAKVAFGLDFFLHSFLNHHFYSGARRCPSERTRIRLEGLPQAWAEVNAPNPS